MGIETIALIAGIAAAAGSTATGIYQAVQSPEVPAPVTPATAPAGQAAVKAPTTESAAVQQATAEAAQRRQRSRGFRSTILRSMAESQGGLKQTFGS